MKKLLPFLCLYALSPMTQASTAYGALSNFDAVNDTGVEAHGFEIEIDDVHSTAIQYTYDWNHYGAPKITEDNTDPLRPKTFVRYESKKDASGNYLSYTAVPVGAFPPTQGHQCTNPAVNEGCEHFGVSFYAPSLVKYHWLIDNPAAPGNLMLGAEVQISAPSWTYQPPVLARPAQVAAVIPAPPEPLPVAKQFGKPSWVKVIKTKLHNNKNIPLDDLISGDKNGDGKADWANGEVAEVETEWYLLQPNAGKNGKKLKLLGKAEPLQKGDEKITRRYEFYKYAGSALSRDGETDEAMCDKVANDGIHGAGVVDVTDAFGNGYQHDCGTEKLIGAYTGAQMVGFAAAAPLGLIEHLQDGEINKPYVKRTVVVGGNTPYLTTVTGALPKGLTLSSGKGILSGTPTEGGVFNFTVNTSDANNVLASKAYTLNIAGCAQFYVPIKTLGRNFIVVNNGLAAADHVWYATKANTTFVDGATNFLAGEFVSFKGTLDAIGSCHATSMTVYPKVSYGVLDKGTSTVSSVGDHFVMVGAKKIIWNSKTVFTLNRAAAIAVGMKVVWAGKLNAASNTVLAGKLVIN